MIGGMWSINTIAKTLIVVFALAGQAMGGEEQISIQDIDGNELINELTAVSDDPDLVTMVFWLPEEFWDWSFSQDPSLSSEVREQMVSVIRPYAMFGIVDGKMGPFGGVSFVNFVDLRRGVVLVDGSGGRHKPLSEDVLSPDALNLGAMMKPVLTNFVGPLGENMYFFFFESTVGEGAAIASPQAPGRFSVEVGDQVFDWKTPLSTVIPPKFCPIDNEKMNGTWKYCPFHGAELLEPESE